MTRFFLCMQLGLALAVTAALPGQAKATLIGDDVTFELFSDGRSAFGPFTETVDAGAEFNVVEQIAIDVGASSIDFVVIGEVGRITGNFDFVLTDLDWIGEAGVIIDLVLDAVQGIGSVSFTEDSVSFSVFEGDSVSLGVLASIEIVTRHASVPEPGTLALLGLGLAGLGFSRRRLGQAA